MSPIVFCYDPETLQMIQKLSMIFLNEFICWPLIWIRPKIFFSVFLFSYQNCLQNTGNHGFLWHVYSIKVYMRTNFYKVNRTSPLTGIIKSQVHSQRGKEKTSNYLSWTNSWVVLYETRKRYYSSPLKQGTSIKTEVNMVARLKGCWEYVWRNPKTL